MAGQIFGGGAPKTNPVPAPKLVKPAAMPMGPGGSSTGSGLGQAQQAPQPVIRPEVKAVSDTLSYAEGTWNKEANAPNYGMRYGDRTGEASLDINQPHPGDVRSSAYGSGYQSDASGAFQFKKDTWNEMHGGNNAVMSPENQDLAVGKLITAEGYDYNEPFAEESFKLSNRWASIPNAQGVSDYGQPTPHSTEELDTFHRQRLQQLQELERMRVYGLR